MSASSPDPRYFYDGLGIRRRDDCAICGSTIRWGDSVLCECAFTPPYENTLPPSLSIRERVEELFNEALELNEDASLSESDSLIARSRIVAFHEVLDLLARDASKEAGK